MSGIRLGQLANSITDNDDLPIGYLTASALGANSTITDKYIVAQVTNKPGWTNNPFIRYNTRSMRWEFADGTDGIWDTFARIRKPNIFEAKNTFSQDVDIFGNLALLTKSIALNKGSLFGVDTGNCGLDVYKTSLIVGYLKTNATFNGWVIKAEQSGTANFLLSGGDRAYTFPDKDGTVALTSDIPDFGLLTPNRALITINTGQITTSVTTDTEVSYLTGVRSSIQGQLDLLAPKHAPVFTSNVTLADVSAGVILKDNNSQDYQLFMHGGNLVVKAIAIDYILLRTAANEKYKVFVKNGQLVMTHDNNAVGVALPQIFFKSTSNTAWSFSVETNGNATLQTSNVALGDATSTLLLKDMTTSLPYKLSVNVEGNLVLELTN